MLGMPKWASFFAALFLLAGTSNCWASDQGPAPKYHVEYRDESGHETSAVFDLTKAEDAKRFNDLAKTGKIVKVKEEHIPPLTQMFSLRWDLGLWTLVVFGALLFILSKTAWPAMLQGLKKREQNIADAFASAENAKNEAEKARHSLQAQMAKANDEIRGMIEVARRDAAATKEDMIASAKKEIGSERDRLRREIDAARDQALLDIYNKSTQLAAMISAKTIRREIRPDDHKRLFDEALSEFKAAAGNATGNG